MATGPVVTAALTPMAADRWMQVMVGVITTGLITRTEPLQLVAIMQTMVVAELIHPEHRTTRAATVMAITVGGADLYSATRATVMMATGTITTHHLLDNVIILRNGQMITGAMEDHSNKAQTDHNAAVHPVLAVAVAAGPVLVAEMVVVVTGPALAAVVVEPVPVLAVAVEVVVV